MDRGREKRKLEEIKKLRRLDEIKGRRDGGIELGNGEKEGWRERER